jgi:hypothetical protein
MLQGMVNKSRVSQGGSETREGITLSESSLCPPYAGFLYYFQYWYKELQAGGCPQSPWRSEGVTRYGLIYGFEAKSCETRDTVVTA